MAATSRALLHSEVVSRVLRLYASALSGDMDQPSSLSHELGQTIAPEERVRNLLEELRRREKQDLAGRIAASIIHEINNPLEAITNLLYLALCQADDPGRVRSYLMTAEEQLSHLREIAQQTLSLSRETPVPSPTDLVGVIDTVLRLHAGILTAKDVQLRRQLPLTLVIAIYPGDFVQLISNLVRNAVEALPYGGSLCIRLRSFPDRIRLTIADNGCGIPSSFHPRIYKAFETSKMESGNGLGLWLCKSIVDKHSGRISFRTSVKPEASGTTFSVSLPA